MFENNPTELQDRWKAQDKARKIKRCILAIVSILAIAYIVISLDEGNWSRWILGLLFFA